MLLNCGKMLMLGTVLLLIWCTFMVDATGGIYHVERQDFTPSQPPVPRSLSYQNLVNGRNGVHKVDRQDFAGNAPFSQNSGPLFGAMYGYHYYPLQKVLYTYGQLDNGYQPPYGAGSTLSPPLPPRLFVPAEAAYEDGATNRQPNYQNVLSLSEYNRSFQQVPSYLQPSVPSYPQPHVLSSSWSSVKPFWFVASTSPATLLSTTTPTPTPLPITSSSPASATHSPLLPATSANEDDGILPPISVNDEENKPLPPIPTQDSLRKIFVTENPDAVGNRHTKVKYHSFNDFVEISDEHRELLESFGSIQNNESDFSELPDASPIRRRRNASHSQVFSMFSVRATGLSGPPAVRLDPEQLIDTYVNRLWQQIGVLNDMKRALRHVRNQKSVKLSPKTMVAADDSTVIVFNGNENFDGKLYDQVAASYEDPSEGMTQSSVKVPLIAESANMDNTNLSENLLPSSKEGNPSRKESAEPKSGDALIWTTNVNDGSHKSLYERAGRTDTHPTSDPRDQIIYLPKEKFETVTYDSAESWEDSE